MITKNKQTKNTKVKRFNDSEEWTVDLKNDATITNWLNGVSNEPRTRTLYTFGVQCYCKYNKMTPLELLEEAEEDLANHVKTRESRLKDRINGFRSQLINEGKAPMTVRARMKGVYSFYKQNDIPVPKPTADEKKARPLKENMEIPEKKDLQEVLKYCDPLERAIVLIGVSSGLAEQEMSNLTIGDFEKGYDQETGVTTLSLRREKAQFDFITYLNPEATQAVLDYLAFRNRKPIENKDKEWRINQAKKQKTRKGVKSDYLLIKRRISDNYLKTHNEKLRQIKPKSFCDIYEIIAEKANKGTPKGTWGLIRSHNIRKYYSNTLEAAGLERRKINFWMGHTETGMELAYFHAKTNERDIYMQYMSCLSLAEAYDPEKDPSYKKMKESNKAQSIVIENIASESKTAKTEIENLKKAQQEAEQKSIKIQQEAEDMLKKAQQETKRRLKEAEQEAHNEWMALQADHELENKARAHEMEEMKRQMNELRQMFLGSIQERNEKNMPDKRPVKLNPEEEKELNEMWDN